MTTVLPNDAGELRQVIRRDGRLCLGRQSPRTASVNLGTPHPNTEYTLDSNNTRRTTRLRYGDPGRCVSMFSAAAANVITGNNEITLFTTRPATPNALTLWLLH